MNLLEKHKVNVFPEPCR